MIVGKTSSSMTKSEVLHNLSETQILSSVFPQISELPCLICSPLRKDTHPSFSIYVNSKGYIRYKDHACPDVQGGLLDLLCAYWNCSFKDVLDRISHINPSSCCTSASPSRNSVSLKGIDRHSSDVQVAIRPWHQYDYDYWASYGISSPWLRYAEIYPVSHKIVTVKSSSGNDRRFVIPCDKYAYCFVERKDSKVQLKIYQPFNTRGFKWCSKMDSSVIGLWTKVPSHGDRIVICSSLKDALTLSCQLHIPSLCLQGEGYSMSNTAVCELKRRFSKVFICFDTDAPGIADSRKLASSTGFTNVIPDLGSEKDLSDYYKSLEDKSQFQKLKNLFI